MTVEKQGNENPFSTAENFRAHLDKIQSDAIKTDNIKEAQPQVKEEINATKSDSEPTVSEKEMVSQEDTGLDNDDIGESIEEAKAQSTEKEPRLIPKSRLKQETEKRRVAEEQLMKEREERLKEKEEYIRAQTQLEMLTQNKEPAQPQYREPELEQLDALDQDAHRVYSNKIRNLEHTLQQVISNTSQQTQALQIENIVKNQRESFQKENPDFEKALNHYTDVELAAAKMFIKNEDEAKQAVANKFANIVHNAVHNGKNAPEVFYNLAKTYGYAATKSEASSEGNNEPNVDLDAINRNKQKTSSINKLGNKASVGNGNNVFDIKQCLRDPKNPASGIDPDKFAQYRQRIAKSAS